MERMMLVPAATATTNNPSPQDVLKMIHARNEQQYTNIPQTVNPHLLEKFDIRQHASARRLETVESSQVYDALSLISDGLRPAATKLLNFLNDRIPWNQHGEVIVNNQVLTNSNIVDILTDLLSKRTNLVSNPVHINTIVAEMTRLNVPKSYINYKGMQARKRSPDPPPPAAATPVPQRNAAKNAQQQITSQSKRKKKKNQKGSSLTKFVNSLIL